MLTLSCRLLSSKFHHSQQKITQRPMSNWMCHEQSISVYQILAEWHWNEIKIFSIRPWYEVSLINDSSLNYVTVSLFMSLDKLSIQNFLLLTVFKARTVYESSMPTIVHSINLNQIFCVMNESVCLLLCRIFSMLLL